MKRLKRGNMTKTIAINATLKWHLPNARRKRQFRKRFDWANRIAILLQLNLMVVLKNVLILKTTPLAVKILLDDLIRFNIIKSYDEITGVGHRAVSGEHFKESGQLLKAMPKNEELGLLAPLQCKSLQIFVPSKNCCQISGVAVLIHHSTQQCQKSMPLSITNRTIQKTKFVNTVHTEQVTNTAHKKQQKLGRPLGRVEIDHVPYR